MLSVGDRSCFIPHTLLQVIEACKTHVPSMGCGFSNPKLTLHTGDGAKFLEETQDKFDVIITDASDPVVNTDQEDGETKDGGCLLPWFITQQPVMRFTSF